MKPKSDRWMTLKNNNYMKTRYISFRKELCGSQFNIMWGSDGNFIIEV